MQTLTQKKFTESLSQLLRKEGPAVALSTITGCFVSIVVAAMEANGHDAGREIKINGGENRDITIHAPKPPNP